MTLDNLKDKVAELSDDLKLKAKEAQVQGQKVLDDVKHKASEAKIEGEKAFNDLKQKATDKINELKKDDDKA